MKDKTGTIIVAVLFLVLIASWAFAKPWRNWQGSGGWGVGTAYARLYNPAQMVILTGEVVEVEQVVPLKGMNNGVQLLVKTETGIVPVHLGPVWYVERLDIKIAKGDKIEVKGSKVDIQGKATFIAAEVKKGEAVLTLRETNGNPIWAGWRR